MNSPTPEELRALRTAAVLTQTQLGALVYSSLRAVQAWEDGTRRMPAGLWELLRLKTGEAFPDGHGRFYELRLVSASGATIPWRRALPGYVRGGGAVISASTDEDADMPRRL